jgi:hypothetical protein
MRERYTLVLEPLPGVNGTQALRHLLKVALRRCGLRCIDARETHPDTDTKSSECEQTPLT